MTGIDLLRTAEIKKIPLFQGFNDTDYSQIADVADVVLFGPKKLVLEQGCRQSRMMGIACRYLRGFAANRSG